MRKSKLICLIPIVAISLSLSVHAKPLETRAEVQGAITNALKTSCINAMNDGAVKMNQKYVSSVCECLVCIFDATDGEEVANSFIESGGKDTSVALFPFTVVIDRYENECKKYYYKERSSDPCKQVKAMVKERIDKFGE